MNFADVKSMFIPEGEVYIIFDGDGNIIWQKQSGEPYTFLEYITATGTQWIDTEIQQLDNTFKFEIEASISSIAANASAYLFSNQGNTSMSIRNSSNRGIAYARYWNSSQTQLINTTLSTFQTKRTYGLWNNKAYIDSNNYGITARTASSGGNILVFSQNGSSGASGNIYGFTLEAQGDVIMHLIPAIDNDTQEVGMYDEISDTFFTNAGSGSFIAGPEI